MHPVDFWLVLYACGCSGAAYVGYNHNSRSLPLHKAALEIVLALVFVPVVRLFFLLTLKDDTLLESIGLGLWLVGLPVFCVVLGQVTWRSLQRIGHRW